MGLILYLFLGIYIEMPCLKNGKKVKIPSLEKTDLSNSGDATKVQDVSLGIERSYLFLLTNVKTV